MDCFNHQEMVNCMRCRFRHEDNGNCTAVGGFCTAVPAAHCPLLRKYLDIGLTPEQCETAKVIIESAFSDDTSKAERIRELLKADKDGRLVVLPCKVGDTVYRLQYIEQTPGRFVVGVAEIKFALIWLEDVGKTVFLTREEAEKALEVAKRDG